jgi:hypothetical protein
VSRPNPSQLWSLLPVVLGLAFFALAVLVAVGRLEGKDAVIVAGLGAAAAGCLALARSGGRTVLQRVKSVNVGVFAIELLEDARASANDTSLEEGSEDWIASASVDNDEADRADVDTESQARLASRLLTLRDEDVAVLPPDRRAEFIREATRLVGNILASVFSAMVKKEAEALSSGGWEIKKTPRGWRRSEVLIARDGARARLVPVWATTPGPKATERITQAKDRIERTRLPEHTDRDIIVVPPRPRAPSDRAATPSIVRLDELSAALA